MHILFVADADSKYGAQNSLLGLVKSLKRVNDSLKISIVVTKHFDMIEDFAKVNCDVYQMPYEPFCQAIPPFNIVKQVAKYVIRGCQYLYGRWFALNILEKQLNINTVDLIHSNSSREDFGALIAKKYSKPLIWHIREFGDLDYRCYSYRRDYISFMKENATIFIAISDDVRRHWIEKGLSAKKIMLIYNGVQENKVQKDKVKNVTDNSFRLVMMGSLCETKGQHQIIRAIALLPEEYRDRVHLDLVGDGARSYTWILKHMVKSLHLEKNVKFLGYQRNFYSELVKYDCGVMCSKCEGFGRVTVEYMMAGLPVLASDTGANPELVENEKNGLLYHYPNVEELKDKLMYMINNRENVIHMGIVAKSMGNRFTELENAKAVYQIYQDILHIK